MKLDIKKLLRAIERWRARDRSMAFFAATVSRARRLSAVVVVVVGAVSMPTHIRGVTVSMPTHIRGVTRSMFYIRGVTERHRSIASVLIDAHSRASTTDDSLRRR